MKREYFIIRIMILLLAAGLFSCDKEEAVIIPSVETASVDEIYNTSARVGGRVADNRGAEITDRGVYWGVSPGPESTGEKLQIGTGTGTFYETLSDLTSGEKYYVKAYAANISGVFYGDETFFTTQISLPVVITSQISEYTSTSARIGGVVSDNGGYEITQRGVYWGIEPNPRLKGTKLVMGSGDGEFSENLTDLSRAFTYYVIAYATNIKGTSYGKEISFSTEPELPVVFTSSILDITPYSAMAGGNVSSSGGMEVTDRGIYWGSSPDPVSTGTKRAIGSGTGIFVDSLEILDPAVTYYVVAYAVNSIGTSYGEEKSFLTLGEAPEITSLYYTDLLARSVTLNGIVNANDLSTDVTFEYGLSDSYGNSMIPANSPSSEDNDTVFVSIAELEPGTLYHFRIKAENDLGPVYSEDMSFTTVITGETGTVDDSEGNTYQTIGIGYQEWMTENLRSVMYRNGIDSIPLLESDTSWAKTDAGAYCWYANDSTSNSGTYGALYNWYAVSSNQLCPSGWHVPDIDDFNELISYAGGSGLAGGALKEEGTVHWNSPNTGATNDFDFNAYGSGKRFADGVFDMVKVEANWWTSTDYSTLNSTYLNILFSYSNIFQAYTSKKTGMSVRCVKNRQ